MKGWISLGIIVSAIILGTGQGHAQGTLQPLNLFINGSGTVESLQNGQLFEVDQNYQMTAIPDAGFVFSSWQPANVFNFTEVTLTPSGEYVTNSSVVPSLIPQYTYTPTLTFTMQPAQVIYDVPGVRLITETTGWQVNFVPVPEPGSIALIGCGLALACSFRVGRMKRLI